MTNMLILGPPGSGKGTQAEQIAARLGIPAISTGEMFRAHVDAATPLGLEARKYLDEGNFVPDSVTNAMVRERLHNPDAGGGFLLDGYPRNTKQLEVLDGILASLGTRLDLALQLTAEDGELVERMLSRARISGRSDDTEDVIRHRLEVYYRQTEPVAAAYAGRGILLQVDGDGDIGTVTERIVAAMRGTGLEL
ncbi:adenylate kinase [Arthrobacter sp. CJ23]|uniref:adenylate kinase n=1 Tax=Arthrobacter sp. CJ23 TaxID=2972479 RepID=UPI00215BCC86|nr:adenylate kinase [Arthrobacter sp. CJ23]UVJ40088.1 adenylate kinase [Arthrobacter sp. CJ23]